MGEKFLRRATEESISDEKNEFGIRTSKRDWEFKDD
jgi:hypothetical protein